MRFLPAITWFSFITYLFLIPGTALPQESWFEKVYLDKWVHTGFFFLLVYLFFISLKNQSRYVLRNLVLLSMFYGLAIELLQGYCVKDRSFDLVDILADGIGSLGAYCILRKQAKK